MTDPTLNNLLPNIIPMLFKELAKYWYFWLTIAAIILLVELAPVLVKRYIKNNNYPLDNKGDSKTRCPKCGADLIEKRKYGRFLACSNYPKCRFTKKID